MRGTDRECFRQPDSVSMASLIWSIDKARCLEDASMRSSGVNRFLEFGWAKNSICFHITRLVVNATKRTWRTTWFQIADKRRRVTRNESPSTVRSTPLNASTMGAVNLGTSAPVTRLPIGIPPRKATL